MTTREVLLTGALGAVAGVAASLAKGKAEGVLQPLGERAFPPHPAQQIELGADPAGHPENMPPSELVDRAQHAVTGDQLTDDQRQRLSEPVHWTTGVGFGVLYALAARRRPSVRTGFGTLAGTALFGATHGSVLPLAGVQDSPARLPTAWWVWEGGSHLVYGAALDLTLRAVERVAGRE